MFKQKQHVRADYHELISSTESHSLFEKYAWLLKGMIIFGLGFAFGMIYAKSTNSFCSETLAMSAPKGASLQESDASKV